MNNDYDSNKPEEITAGELKFEHCSECKRPLLDPVREVRENGNVELVTYCRCGAVYTN